MGDLFAQGGTTGYPGAIDTHTAQQDDPDAGAFGVTSTHASKVNNLASALEAIEGELGTNPSDAADDTATPADSASTVKAKLNMILRRLKDIIGGTGWKDSVPASLTALNNSLGSKASTAHEASHLTGGSDPFLAGDLLDATARVVVRKNTGANVGTRRRLNLVEGAGIALTVADDAAGEEVDITIAANAPTPAAHKNSHKVGGGDAFVAGDLLDATAKTAVRKNTGGADVGSRRRLNFIEGTGILLTVADDAAGEEIDITITYNPQAPVAHKATHVSGGGDAFQAGDLLDATAKTAVRKNTGGADVGSRRRLNFIEGSNVTLTIADDSAGEEIDITIAAATGIAASVITAKGDIVCGSAASTPSVLPAAANGAVPYTKSSQSVGLTYAAAGTVGQFLCGGSDPAFREVEIGDLIGPTGVAAGDIVRRNSGNTAWERVAVGGAKSILRTVSGAPAWSNGYAGPSTQNLVAANNAGTPNSKVDVTANEVTLVDPATGEFLRISAPASKTCDTTVAGPAADGRDQAGAFSASSWVHLYYIGKSDGTLATVWSTVAPPTGPTFPTGYSYWAYLGAFRLDGSTNLIKMKISGSLAAYEDGNPLALSGGSATSETAVDLSTFIPPNAVAAHIVLSAKYQDTSAGVQCNLRTRWKSGTSNFFMQIALITQVANIDQGFAINTVEHPHTSQNIYYLWTAATGTRNAYVNVLGYRIPNGGA